MCQQSDRSGALRRVRSGMALLKRGWAGIGKPLGLAAGDYLGPKRHFVWSVRTLRCPWVHRFDRRRDLAAVAPGTNALDKSLAVAPGCIAPKPQPGVGGPV